MSFKKKIIISMSISKNFINSQDPIQVNYGVPGIGAYNCALVCIIFCILYLLVLPYSLPTPI